jgi:hypothetical protein
MSERPAPAAVVDNTASVSDNIRALARAGYSRSEIAGLLGKRYQHVRNVLVDDERRQRPPAFWADRPAGQVRGMAEGQRAYEPPPVQAGEILVWIDVAPDGSLRLPEPACAALEVAHGGKVLATVADNGSVIILSAHAAMRQAQALVRRYTPPGVSLADELIAERRAEVARENEDG